jgi:NhaP-type Na+/H+ or K+/H+ antiporter
LDWRNAVIVVWGGLRGAVGLALALIVFEEHAFDQRVSFIQCRCQPFFHISSPPLQV